MTIPHRQRVTDKSLGDACHELYDQIGYNYFAIWRKKENGAIRYSIWRRINQQPTEDISHVFQHALPIPDDMQVVAINMTIREVWNYLLGAIHIARRF